MRLAQSCSKPVSKPNKWNTSTTVYLRDNLYVFFNHLRNQCIWLTARTGRRILGHIPHTLIRTYLPVSSINVRAGSRDVLDVRVARCVIVLVRAVHCYLHILPQHWSSPMQCDICTPRSPHVAHEILASTSVSRIS